MTTTAPARPKAATRQARTPLHRDSTLPRALAGLLADPGRDWQKQGLCTQTDPEAFHPETRADSDMAKKICESCPVNTRCLIFGLEGHDFGIWGGTTHKDREKIRSAAASIGTTGSQLVATAAKQNLPVMDVVRLIKQLAPAKPRAGVPAATTADTADAPVDPAGQISE